MRLWCNGNTLDSKPKDEDSISFRRAKLKNMELSKNAKGVIDAYNKGYRISECGNFLTYKNRIHTQKHFKSGYPVFYCRNLKNEKLGIKWHRLQAYQKYGNLLFEENTVVRHLNAIRTDCSLNNILIGTHQENTMDKPEEMRKRCATIASSFMKKYNHEDVILYYEKCKSYKETMEKFNISSKSTLSFILNKSESSNKN